MKGVDAEKPNVRLAAVDMSVLYVAGSLRRDGANARWVLVQISKRCKLG